MKRLIPGVLLGILLSGAVAGTARADEPIYYRTDENGVMVITNVPDRKDFRAYPGIGRIGGARMGDRYGSLIRKIALRNGLEPDLVYEVIRVESNFDPMALSRKGAQGLMQLMPRTARRLGVSDAFDPADNIDGGVRYLRYLLDRFGGDTRLALAAYNAGETVVRALNGVPPYRETRNYVAKVLRRFGSARTPYVAR